MQDNQHDDEMPEPRLRFDDYTRQKLSEEFRRKITGRNYSDYHSENSSEVFLAILEGYAAAIPIFAKYKPPKQEIRKELLASLSLHLSESIDKIKKIDDAALGYALWCGFEQMAKLGNEENPLAAGMAACFEAEILRETYIKDLEAFQLGVQKAAKNLPLHSLNTSGDDCEWYSMPTELSTATAIEKLFIDNGLDFTLSESGFSAACLRAVFALGGLNIDRVSYWLKKAKNHKNSWSNFYKSFAAKPQK
jgi:hypothetical protein